MSPIRSVTDVADSYQRGTGDGGLGTESHRLEPCDNRV